MEWTFRRGIRIAIYPRLPTAGRATAEGSGRDSRRNVWGAIASDKDDRHIPPATATGPVTQDITFQHYNDILFNVLHSTSHEQRRHAFLIPLRTHTRKTTFPLTNSFRNGSVDGSSISATSCSASSLRQTENPGCSPGCRKDWHCVFNAVAHCHSGDDRLLRLIAAWPVMDERSKAAIVMLAGPENGP